MPLPLPSELHSSASPKRAIILKMSAEAIEALKSVMASSNLKDGKPPMQIEFSGQTASIHIGDHFFATTGTQTKFHEIYRRPAMAPSANGTHSRTSSSSSVSLKPTALQLEAKVGAVLAISRVLDEAMEKKIKESSVQAEKDRKSRKTLPIDTPLANTSARKKKAVSTTATASSLAKQALRNGLSGKPSTSGNLLADASPPNTPRPGSSSSVNKRSPPEDSHTPIRSRVIHELALKSLTVAEVMRMVRSNNEEDVTEILTELCQPSETMPSVLPVWTLKPDAYFEINPYTYLSYSTSERERIAADARRAYDVLGLPEDAAQRGKLLKSAERYYAKNGLVPPPVGSTPGSDFMTSAWKGGVYKATDKKAKGSPKAKGKEKEKDAGETSVAAEPKPAKATAAAKKTKTTTKTVAIVENRPPTPVPTPQPPQPAKATAGTKRKKPQDGDDLAEALVGMLGDTPSADRPSPSVSPKKRKIETEKEKDVARTSTTTVQHKTKAAVSKSSSTSSSGTPLATKSIAPTKLAPPTNGKDHRPPESNSITKPSSTANADVPRKKRAISAKYTSSEESDLEESSVPSDLKFSKAKSKPLPPPISSASQPVFDPAAPFPSSLLSPLPSDRPSLRARYSECYFHYSSILSLISAENAKNERLLSLEDGEEVDDAGDVDMMDVGGLEALKKAYETLHAKLKDIRTAYGGDNDD